jgi:adenine-specific DNA-methyltransferase
VAGRFTGVRGYRLSIQPGSETCSPIFGLERCHFPRPGPTGAVGRVPVMLSDSIPNLDQISLTDCRDLLSELPDECVDLVVTSPPYNLGKEYEARVALQEYVEGQRTVIRECARVLKASGSIFWQVGSFSDKGQLIPLDIRFFPVLEEVGLLPRNRIMWIRQHGLHARKKFSARHETILWFSKSDGYQFNLDPIRVPQKYQGKTFHKGDRRGELSCNPDGKNPGDIWSFRNVKHNHEEQTVHPCQFPEDLVARIMLCTTRPGDIVLDPYMGTGTTAVVAQDFDRHFVGAELDPGYHEVALRRLTGEPNADGSFSNLKALRAWVKRTGEPVERFKFDAQRGKKPSLSSKIFPEDHHRAEIEGRLEMEEEVFGQRARGKEVDPDLLERIATTQGNRERNNGRSEATSAEARLF